MEAAGAAPGGGGPTGPVRVLLVSGSTRNGSTNTAALRTVDGLGVPGVLTAPWQRLVELPAYVPDAGAVPAVVASLSAAVTSADAVLFCTPEYAGTLPGSLKNGLDWLVGGGELYARPVAWVGVGAPGRGLGAERALAGVLGYLGADIVPAACARVPVARELVLGDGTVHDPAVKGALRDVLTALAAHVRRARGAAPEAG